MHRKGSNFQLRGIGTFETPVLYKFESVKFSVIGSVICLLTDSSAK